jgi:hypothetical protein
MLLSSLSPDALNDLHLPEEALAALASHTEWAYPGLGGRRDGARRVV